MSLTPSTSSSSSSSGIQCSVCQRNADSCNYGVFTCDACKMFFRRATLLNTGFVCQKNNRCLNVRVNSLSYCRACRYQKCLEAGMKLKAHNMIEVKNKKDDAMVNLISSLKYHDNAREKFLLSSFTFDDPSLKEIVEGKKIKIVTRDPSYKMCNKDWCFLGAYSAAKFLMELDFVRVLDFKDQILIIRNYFINASVLINAFKSMKAKNNSQQTPDGVEFYTEKLLSVPEFSHRFVRRIRSQLVEKLIELSISKEELLLVIIVFFSNPALPSLSTHAIEMLSHQQNIYSSALFQCCQRTHQQAAPSRFTDLLSLCHVVNKNYEDVEYLHMIFQMITKEPLCRLMSIGFGS